MRVRSNNGGLVFLRLVILALAIVAVQPSLAQSHPERFWLAGRYDGNRIIVYFDAVKFNGTVPTNVEKLACPIALGFFCPVKLPANYIAQFQKEPNAEHFALGDKYDLLLDEGSVAPVTITTLVGAEGDEETGNDSFIGALATLEKDKDDWLAFTRGNYAVRRHRELAGGTGKDQKTVRTLYACLLNEPLRFDMQSKIVELLNSRMRTMATDAQRHEAERVSPLFAVQQFRLADGTLRYYARAGWTSGKGSRETLIYGLAVWIAPQPTLHVLAADSAPGFQYLPDLLNVIDLGGGSAGIIVSEHGDDSGSLSLVEYRDGMDLRHMRTLQSIGAGE